jgi:hypothetical protein
MLEFKKQKNISSTMGNHCYQHLLSVLFLSNVAIYGSEKVGISKEITTLAPSNIIEGIKILKKEEKEIKMETTLIILKPDCMEKGLWWKVLSRFDEENFKIVGCKMMSLSESLLKDHYAHLVHLPFFPEVVSFMQSKPVMVIALRGKRLSKSPNFAGANGFRTCAERNHSRGLWYGQDAQYCPCF